MGHLRLVGQERNTIRQADPASKVSRPPDQHQEGRGPSRERRELFLNKVLQHLQTVILQG